MNPPNPSATPLAPISVGGIAIAVPVYLAQATWRNPESGKRRAVQLVGFDTEAGVMDFPGLAPHVSRKRGSPLLRSILTAGSEYGPVTS